MKSRIVTMSLLCAVGLSPLAWAKPTTAPSTKPAAPPLKALTDEVKAEFPSPAELMRKMKAEKDKKSKLAKVAYFDLQKQVVEQPAGFSLFGDDRLTVRTLVERLHQAKADKDVKSVLITLGESGLGLSQAIEVRDALKAVKAAGKPVFVYADSYDTTDYMVASGASDIVLLEGGEIMIPGIGIESMFAKGLFDKVGVKADYVQIGEYKGADEQYTRSEATAELRGEMNKLVEALYGQIVQGIADNRKLSADVVKQTIDEMILTGKNAKARGFVDHLTDQDGLRDLISKKVGGEIDLLTTYGAPERQAVDFSNPFALLQSLTKKEPAEEAAESKPAVALIYAEGVITDGGGGDGIFEEAGVASEPMRKAFRMAMRDDNVKAVVIRIDSPGGSALASEVMWQAARRLAAKKPVIISIGGMAASGGYYLASAGETIFADDTAIVGSIGVVGGKFVMKDLFAKLGVTTETFSRGRNAGLFSSNEPFTDRQRTMVTNWMKQTYDQFTDRVMTTRKGKIKDIDAVARGRIFIAKQAKELGMVDEIGGINDALAFAAKKVNLEPSKYDVRLVPEPKTLGDYLSGNAGPEARFPFQPKVEISAEGLLGQVAPPIRRAMKQHLQMMGLLQDRPVILVSPYVVTVK